MSSLSGPAAKATILVVDDESSILEVLTEELQTRYGRDYRVLAASSSDEALDHLRSMADAGDEVALILADQWLPTTSGVELLAAARQLHPIARRGLLVAWGDRSAVGPILQAAALGRIDYYVAKPVFSPTSASTARSPSSSTSGGGYAGGGSRCSAS